MNADGMFTEFPDNAFDYLMSGPDCLADASTDAKYSAPPKYIKLESYLTKYVSHSDISHGICESCFEELYPDFYENIK